MAAIETIMTAFVDFYPILRKWKPVVAAVICFIMFILGLPMCAEVGRGQVENIKPNNINSYETGSLLLYPIIFIPFNLILIN